MNITTRINRQPVRASVAFAMGAAVLLAASACGTDDKPSKRRRRASSKQCRLLMPTCHQTWRSAW